MRDLVFWSIILQSIIIAYLELNIKSGIGRRLSNEPLSRENNLALAGIVGAILLGILLSTNVHPPTLKEYWMNKRIGILYSNAKRPDTNFIATFFIRRTAFVMIMNVSYFTIAYGL